MFCPLLLVVGRHIVGRGEQGSGLRVLGSAERTRDDGQSWNRVFRNIFVVADPAIEGGHPQRFRDSFAVRSSSTALAPFVGYASA